MANIFDQARMALKRFTSYKPNASQMSVDDVIKMVTSPSVDTQPAQRFIGLGVSRVKESLKNPDQYNFYSQAAKGNVPSFDALKPAQRFIGNYVQNRYVQPVLDIPKNYRTVTDPASSLKDRILSGLGLVGGLATFVPDPVQDAILPLSDFSKGYRSQAIRGGSLSQRLDAGSKAMSLEQPVGLGTSITTNPEGEFLGNAAELPLLMASVGALNKKISPNQKALFEEKINPTVAQKLSAVDTSTLRRQPGSYTNVRNIDNPMVQGETAMKEFRATMLKKLSEFRSKYSPRIEQTVKETVGQEFNPQTPVSKKINILDYVRTPDRVLQKIGLGEEAKTLRRQYERYLDELPQELQKIEAWSKRVGQESNERIFRQLDGENILLTKQEQEVASEIRTYLKVWAQKLNLPKEKRITNYITRLYEKGAIEQDFPEDIAKLINGKIPKDVYNPFTQRRVSARLDYKRDTWGALEAYVKRGTRQYNLQPALEAIERRSPNLELSQVKYITNLTERINMRPTEIDTLIDNAVKSSPIGYRLGQRPVTSTTRALRQQVFRGTIGLNVSTALRNLTQVANTYAKLGEKFTAHGYIQLAKKWNSGELERVGVLRDSFLQDKRLPAIKKMIDYVDKGLFYLFERAEKINRGSAYFGAKAKALSEGMSESQAIEYAKKIVRDTQFQFGSIDTPVALQSDIAKTLTQFMSYPVKQSEFLAEMVKKKEWAGLIRWLGSTLVMGKVLKDSFGLSLDIIPFQSIITGETRLGDVPLVKTGRLIGQYAFGDEQSKAEAARELPKNLRTFIPGGVQLGKSAEGLQSYMQGASLTPTGRERFKIEQTTPNLLKSVLFGQYSVPEGQVYVQNLGKSKSEVLYEQLKRLPPDEAAVRVNQIKNTNPTMYRELISYIKDQRMNLSKQEKDFRGLPIKDGSRAKAIIRQLNGKSPDEKAALWKRYVQLGIITDDVAKQLSAARNAGVLK